MFSVFLVLFWLLLFGLLMFRKYSVAMLVSVLLLCPYSVKMSIKKFISLWRCFSVHILYARERKPLDTLIAICVAMFEFGFICTYFVCFSKDFEIVRVITTSVCDSYIKEIKLLVFIFEFNHVLYWWILTVQDV